MSMPFFKHAAISLLLSTGLFAGCVSAAGDTAAVLENYANIVHATYADSLLAAKTLQKAVRSFIAQPSQSGMDEARRAWLAARESYAQTEAFRFYGGPIDDERDVEGRLNAWPLDEAYIDYVKGKPGSGVINDPDVPLSTERLVRLNGRGGEANVATGYHAVEFLLWGQDFNKKGPGNRPFTDFVDGKGKHADRRREYLRLVTDQVVADLEYLTQQWIAGEANYRANFLKVKGEDGLRKMITGMAVLSSAELAGERIQAALDNPGQEDEYSCFSDNTHRDIVNNARGVLNVLVGEYKRLDGSTVKGASIRDMVAAKDTRLAERLVADFTASVAAAEAIQAPFDQEILGSTAGTGYKRVQAVAQSLNKQTQTLMQAARTLGIKKLAVAPAE